MKKFLALLFSVCCLSSVAVAQSKSSAPNTEGKLELGIRMSVTPGVTGVYKLGEQQSIEGLLNFDGNAAILSGFYRYNFGLLSSNIPGLTWYGGAGAHLRMDSGLTLGAGAMIGLQYTFDEAPINISIDWKPSFDIVGVDGGGGHYNDVGLSVRYMF